MTVPAGGTPLLAARAIDKRYPGVHALKGVDLLLRPGEVHAVVGENGAGKSTLMRLLSGAAQPDSGVIEMDGRRVMLRSPHDADLMGIRMIHQELNLVPALSVAENIFLGAEPARRALIDRRALADGARAVLDRLGAQLDPATLVATLSLAARQMVEIGKALAPRAGRVPARVIIMDEPSTMLAGAEVDHLHDLVTRLASDGLAIVYITHRLDEVSRLAHWVTVLRDGRVVRSAPPSELSQQEIVTLMVGRALADGYPIASTPPGRTLFRGEHLAGGRVVDGTLTLCAGEIVGLVGLVGSGRSSLGRILFGAIRPTHGSMWLNGVPFAPRSPRDAIAAGMALLPEDRKSQGLILDDSVRRNVAMATLPAITRGGVIDERLEQSRAAHWIDALDIHTPSSRQPVRLLSGGNQQKVVLARWMLAESRVMIFDEPTRGVDVGARAEIYRLSRDLADAGAAILMISSDLVEALGMSERVLVMREGTIVGDLTRDEATAERVGALMLPAARDAA